MIPIRKFLDDCAAAGNIACSDGQAFALQYSTLGEVWSACKRPGWMLWVLGSSRQLDDCRLRLFAVWCARSVLKPDADPRSVAAIDCAERFAEGKATSEELSAARSAAESAAWSAARSAAWSAAKSAAWIAAWSAAWNAAWSAAWNAAWSAADSAAESAARGAARGAAESAQADALRRIIPDVEKWIETGKP